MATKIFELKIQLNDVSKPPIWRKVEVAASDTLYDLHNIIQGAMGWHNGHLHQFIIYDDHYGIPSPDDFMEVHDERKYKLSKIFLNLKQKIKYEYDFGDGWIHTVTLEAVKDLEKGIKYPLLTKGKSMCPFEDCGGVWGYMELRETLNNPKHSDYEDMREWVGMQEDEFFDPAHFDIDMQTKNMIAAYDAGKKSKGKEFMF